METLVLQTILLLLAAYFIGYFAGYFFRYVSAERKKTVRSTRAAAAAAAAANDDLTRIKGVGPAIAKKLKAIDVHSFKQIAGWNEADIGRINEALGFKDRIQRENWVGQAKTLAERG